MGRTAKLALFGHPVAHTKSDVIHERFGKLLSIDVDYQKIDTPPERFEEDLRRFFEDGGRGCNVTLPHKIKAFRLADERSRRAILAGAVNVFRLGEGGILVGENTDGTGLMHDIEMNLKLQIANSRVLILGASGAARGAAAAAHRRAPARLDIANRDRDRAEELAATVEEVDLVDYADLDLSAYDLIINATSASLYGELPPLPDHRFTAACYDLCYKDEPTVFQTWAMDQGATWASDGWGMLVEQAAETWEFWGLGRPLTTKLLKRKRILRRDD